MYDETKRQVFYSRDMVSNEAKTQTNEGNWIPNAGEGINEPAVDTDYQQNDETDSTKNHN